MEGNPNPQFPGPDTGGSGQEPSEEEMRARLEEQLRQVRVQDLVVESAASIVNLTVRRIAKEDEQDLEQARVGIEAVRALVELVEGDVAGQIRTALSELQILYTRASKGEPLDGGGEDTSTGAAATGVAAPGQDAAPAGPPPGPERPQRATEPPPKLWTPGRD